MQSKNLKTLQLLEAIAENKPCSQRELADSLQISLGLVNSFINRLVKKGYCKITTIPKNRIRYALTPDGVMEKTRLTYEYISSSYHYFKTVTNRLRDLYASLQNTAAQRIVFYGAGELAEIALISMKGTQVRLVDVVDPDREGERFEHFTIKAPSRLADADYDAVVITMVDNHPSILSTLQQAGVAMEKIRFF